MVKKKCVFLDRDGVINRSKVIDGKPYAPRKFKDFIFLPKVKKSIEILKKNNFLVIIITNQPDLSNGRLLEKEFRLMIEKIKKKLIIDDLFYCPHLKIDNCSCRKPRPGMIKLAAKKYEIDLKKSYMIGDRKIDIDAGHKAGCSTIYIKREYKEESPTNFNFIFNTLYNATNFIISNQKYV